MDNMDNKEIKKTDVNSGKSYLVPVVIGICGVVTLVAGMLIGKSIVKSRQKAAAQAYIDWEAQNHTWVEATEQTPKTCSVCGATEGEPLKAGSDTAEPAETVAEDSESPYVVLTDADGKPYDLGGMEIIIHDYSFPSQNEEDSADEYQKALKDWREWAQKTYNFKIEQVSMYDSGTTFSEDLKHAENSRDDNYIFVLNSFFNTADLVDAMFHGLLYDLSSLECLDFSQDKFQLNKVHEKYSRGSGIYAMHAGISVPGDGVYFNKRVLEEAGINPDSIYDMQANGTWTWDAFENIMKQCQRDTDGDGTNDIFGLPGNNLMTEYAVFSNSGSFIGRDQDGYTYNLESPETMEALEWISDMESKYKQPSSAFSLDDFTNLFEKGNVVFTIRPESISLTDMADPVGFVMFPKGPHGDHCVNVWGYSDPVCIPACYDAERAWKIAFAWNLYTNDPPGYENYNAYPSRAAGGVLDSRAINETIPMMCEAKSGVIDYADLFGILTENVLWVGDGENGYDVSESIDGKRDDWKNAIEEANKW